VTNPRPVILVGGGTGGHIFPLVAIGEELASRKIPFIFVGDASGREKQIVEDYGWKFVGLRSGKFRRYWSVQAVGQNLVDLGRFGAGFFEAIGILSRSRARVVFSKGGYVALPMVLAAKLLGKKIVIHESDSVMGLTNRISAKIAVKVLTAFAVEVFPSRTARYEQVGIPIRRALRQAAQLKAPRKSKPLVFVIAGIQGSTTINGLVRQALPTLLPLADIVHITGEAEAALHKNLVKNLSKKFQNAYKTSPFITRELPYYYQAADLIISRASATTIAEAALFAKPMYLIPLPSSAGNHQLKNAQHLQAAGAAILREEKNLVGETMAVDVQRILADKAQMESLGSRLSRYFDEDKTVERIIELITTLNNNG